jgi:hypothetical protein
MGERSGVPSDPSKTLGAEASENVLPAGIEPAMLTDAAKAILGIGSGGSSADEQAVPEAVPATQGAADGEGGGEPSGEGEGK